MKKFSIILESELSKEKDILFTSINRLSDWLYKSTGLGLMSTIDQIFLEQGWCENISFKEVAQFNKGLELLRKTSMDESWINERISWKIPNGKIENVKLVKDELGEWHHVNKLNTNYSDLSDMLSEMIMRSIEVDRERGMVAYKSILEDPKQTLLKWKPQMKKLLEKYFIQLGEGLDDFKKFTKFSKKFSIIGERSEDSIVSYLIDNGFEISYQGGNGDFIDMIFGVDLIVFREDFGFKTIQVKTVINWPSVAYYKVDWIADPRKIFDKTTKEEINI